MDVCACARGRVPVCILALPGPAWPSYRSAPGSWPASGEERGEAAEGARAATPSYQPFPGFCVAFRNLSVPSTIPAEWAPSIDPTPFSSLHWVHMFIKRCVS